MSFHGLSFDALRSPVQFLRQLRTGSITTGCQNTKRGSNEGQGVSDAVNRAGTPWLRCSIAAARVDEILYLNTGAR
jgi:hypothetical protein